MPGWACLLIPGIALLLSDGYGLGRLSLWRDEAYTVDAANRPLLRILAMLGRTDAVNGTYYLIMHADIAIGGTSATALRLPSLLAMAVAAVFTAAIGRHLARAARLPAPALTGVVAGLLFGPALGDPVRPGRAILRARHHVRHGRNLPAAARNR